MAFYRSLLEEELDLGGVGEVDGADLIDDIADHDANTDEQIEAQAAEFGPSDGVDDLLDEMSIAIAESEMNYNKMMQAIGIWEAGELASGRQPLYENAVTDYLKRAKDWVVNFFKKVWSVIQRYAKNIASVFHTNKGLATKYATQIKNGYAPYKNRKGTDNLKMWTFSGLNKMIGADHWKSVSAYLKNFDTDITSYDGEEKEYNSDELGDKIRGRILGSSSKVSTDEFREKVKEAVYGGTEKETGLMDPENVISILKSGKEISETKKMMDKTKKEYKECLSKLQNLEKKFSGVANKYSGEKDKDNQHLHAEANMKRATSYVSAIKSGLSSIQVSRSVILTAMRARMAQARMFAHAYIGAANRDKHKGFQSESANYGFLSNIEFD